MAVFKDDKNINQFKTYHRGIKVNSYADLVAGDQIYIFLTDPIVFEHHGIYCGEGKVIHFANFIVETNLEVFAHGCVIQVVDDDKPTQGGATNY